MATKTDCVHYFIVEEAKRSTSNGVCRDCGEARVFYNSHIYDNRRIPIKGAWVRRGKGI